MLSVIIYNTATSAHPQWPDQPLLAVQFVVNYVDSNSSITYNNMSKFGLNAGLILAKHWTAEHAYADGSSMRDIA